VFDGSQGWKVRPYLNRHEVEAFTPDELKTAATQAGIDGPLMDSAARGISVSVAGKELIEGHDAYKLTLTSKDNQTQHVWVDANSFLEVKMDGTPRRLDGRYHPVAVYLRDYKTVSGLVMPTLLETTVQGVAGSEKIAIANIEVNPSLADTRFAKPQ
jgi:outer membrane lipoprotein-sorting protein